MLEHYAGELPLWLTPVQAIVLPVSDRFNDYGGERAAAAARAGARVELDDRSESVGRKIREAELRKIPYMLIVGEREQAEGTVSVRDPHRGEGDGDERGALATLGAKASRSSAEAASTGELYLGSLSRQPARQILERAA